MKRYLRLVLLAVNAFCAQWVLAQQVITGQLQDAQTKEPLAYVRIKLKRPACGGTTETLADAGGMFSLPLKNCAIHPTDTISVTMLGYESKWVLLQDFWNGDKVLRLSPTSVHLNAVEITALRMTGAEVVRKAYRRIGVNYPTDLYAVTEGEFNGLQQSSEGDEVKQNFYTARFSLVDSGYYSSLKAIAPKTHRYNASDGYKTGSFPFVGINQIDTSISRKYPKAWGSITWFGDQSFWPYYKFDPIRMAYTEKESRFTFTFDSDFLRKAKFGEPVLGLFKLFESERIWVPFTCPVDWPTSGVSGKKTTNIFYRGNLYIDPITYAIVRFSYELVFENYIGKNLVAEVQIVNYAPIGKKQKKWAITSGEKISEMRYFDPANQDKYYSILHEVRVCNLNYGKPAKKEGPPIRDATLPLDGYHCQE